MTTRLAREPVLHASHLLDTEVLHVLRRRLAGARGVRAEVEAH